MSILQKITPIEASMLSSGIEIYNNIKRKLKRREAKFKTEDSVRTGILGDTFCRRDTTSWKHELYPIAKTIDDTHIEYILKRLPRKHEQLLLKKLQLKTRVTVILKNETFDKKLSLFLKFEMETFRK